MTLTLLATILGVIASREELALLPGRLATLAWLPLAAAVALPWVAVLLSSLRWQHLLQLEDIDLPGRWLLGSFLRGRFVGAFTPSTVGLDLYRLVDVSRQVGKRSAVSRALLLEKLYGLVALAVCTFALLPLAGPRLAAVLGGAGAALTALLGMASVLGLCALERPAHLAFLERCPGRLGTLFGRWRGALSAARPSFAQRARLLAFGVGTHLATATLYAATGAALGVEASPFELAMVGNAIVLTTLVPLSVAGIGVREGTALLLLGAIGVPATDAVLLAFLGYLAIQTPALAGGLWRRQEPESTSATEPVLSMRAAL